MNEYHLTPQWKVIKLLWAITVAGLVFGPFAYLIKIFSTLYFMMGLFIIILTVYSISQENITLSEKGIKYQLSVFALDVDWAFLDEIGYYWFIEGLFVDTGSITEFVPNRIFVTHMGFGQNAFIPLSSFSNNWRMSEIGQAIKKYAPRLFD